MCIRSHSESGQPCGFEPCEAYIKLLSEKSRLEGLCAGLEEGNKINLEVIKRQDEQLVEMLADNERLREAMEKQSRAMRNYQSSEAKIASANMENARRLAAECDPTNVESEKQMNAILTEENAALRQERDRLAGIVALADIAAGKAADAIEAADELAESVSHYKDLIASGNYLRERMEELRESVSQPWQMQIDDYTAVVKELANRHTAFDELYECSDYTGGWQIVQDAAKAYQEARHG